MKRTEFFAMLFTPILLIGSKKPNLWAGTTMRNPKYQALMKGTYKIFGITCSAPEKRVVLTIKDGIVIRSYIG